MYVVIGAKLEGGAGGQKRGRWEIKKGGEGKEEEAIERRRGEQ